MTAVEPQLFAIRRATRRRWYRAFPRIEADVDCGGARHRVVWTKGSLILEDHDVAGELAFVALGGKMAPCLALRGAWRDNSILDTFVPRRRRYPPVARADIPDALRPVLIAAGAVATERRWESEGFREDAGELLGAEMTRLAAQPFEAAVRSLVDTLGGRVPVRIECRVAEPGEAPAFTGWVDCTGATASAVLPLRWLTDMSPAGRTLHQDRFVVDLRRRQRAVVDWIRDDDELWSARLVYEPVS